MLEFVLASLFVFLGALVQTSIGFGLAIVAAPLLFALSDQYVPGPITVIALVLSLLVSFRYRASLSLSGLGAAIAGRVPGSIAGGAVLVWADPRWLSLLLGASVLAAVAVSLTKAKITPTTGRLAMAGFMSGLMGTSTSIGGPPLALLLQHESASYMRANLSVFFVASSTLSLLVQIPAGHMSLAHLNMAFHLLPGALLGYLVAQRYGQKLPQHRVRQLSLAICTVSGLFAVLSFWR